MKKNHVLRLLAISSLIMFYSESSGQTSASARKSIERANKKFVEWFNAGKADSIVMQYDNNACITEKGCGKTFLTEYYKTETGKYSFRELTTLEVTLKDNVAIETGQWGIVINGTQLSGKYRTEWKLVQNQWVILKETVL